MKDQSPKQSFVLCLLSTRCTRDLLKLYLGLAELLRLPTREVVVLKLPREDCTFRNEARSDGFDPYSMDSLDNALRESAIRVLPFNLSSDDGGNEAYPEERWEIQRVMKEYQEHPLWEYVKGSVARHCDWDSKPTEDHLLSEQEAKCVSAYFESGRRYIRAFREMYKASCPSHLVVFNGLFYEEQIACRVALEHGIKVFVTEGSAFKGRRTFCQISQADHIRDNFKLKMPQAVRTLRAKRRDRLQDFLGEAYAGRRNRVRQVPRDIAASKSCIPTIRNKKIALFLGQVPYDTVITYDSTITGVPSVVEEVIKFFETRPDWHLIVRLHPAAAQSAIHNDTIAESLSTRASSGSLTLIKAQEASTYDLMDIADLGVTISSQSGLEMLGKYKPVVLLGDAFYRGTGVAIERGAMESIASALARGIRMDISEIWADRVEAVLHYWVFEHLYPYKRCAGAFSGKGRDRIVDLFDDIDVTERRRRL